MMIFQTGLLFFISGILACLVIVKDIDVDDDDWIKNLSMQQMIYLNAFSLTVLYGLFLMGFGTTL